MARFCPNCGNEVEENADICLKCGFKMQNTNSISNNTSSKNSNGMAVAGFILSFFFALLGLIFSIIGLKKSKETNSGKGLSIAGIIISCINMIIGVIIVAISGLTVFSIAEDAKNNAANNNNAESIWDWSTEKEEAKYTLGDTIEFDGLEITFDNNYSFVTVNNQFSEYNNSDVIKLGVNIKNISSEKKSLNSFYFSLFGSKGTELSSVSSFFDEDVDFAGELKPEASYYKYFYILYDGDGIYSIDFDNYTEELSVEFSVTK